MINVDNTNDNVNNINPAIANKNDTRNNESNRSQADNDEDNKIYFKNQMTNDYRREENTLKRIIYNDLKHHNQGKKIKFLIYYKNRKVKTLFIKNNSNKCKDDYNVTYMYSCNKVPCNTTQTCYIGHNYPSICQCVMNDHVIN